MGMLLGPYIIALAALAHHNDTIEPIAIEPVVSTKECWATDPTLATDQPQTVAVYKRCPDGFVAG